MPRQVGPVHVLSKTQLLTSIMGLIVLELLHLKWIWLSEWSCRRCNRKNLECACSGRWMRYL
ncbi:MAG TPA: hypothetical protein VGJ23_02815 [Gaiellaceae bacterium]